jgi:hypothetical protein
MTIPTDEEMKRFRDKIEKEGPAEAKRKLNQQIYLPGGWKSNEVKRFIEDSKSESADKYSQEYLKQIEESNDIAKASNKIAWWALCVSISALLISILVYILK